MKFVAHFPGLSRHGCVRWKPASELVEPAWDRQGVKNYLALSSCNRADGLVQAMVSEDHLGVKSTVGKATENVTYQAADGTVVPRALTLPGGGQQVTPGIGKVVVPSGER